MDNKKSANKLVESSKKKKQGFKTTSNMVLTALAVIGIAFGVFFWQKYDSVKDNPTEAIQQKNTEDSERIFGKIKSLILITEEEAPTIARVEDPSSLQASNPEFYANAKSEDYLVLFPSRAIIYREADNLIVNIAPIINTNELTSGN